MTTIVNNSTSNKVKGAVNATATKKQAPADGSAPPSRAKSDPSSTATTNNKVANSDIGLIEFRDERYPAALTKEVNTVRSNPKKYANILSAYVKSNPHKFKLEDTKFMESLKETQKALKSKGTNVTKRDVVLPPLKYNNARCEIAREGMSLLARSGRDLVTKQRGDGRVDTSDSNFLSYFIDHNLIKHLRKGGKEGEAVTTDLENLHVTTSDSSTARDVIVGWLIDHGVPDKGHRNALLNAGITEIGVGTSTATIVDKNDREITVKITGMNFYGIYDFSKGKLIKDPPTK